MKRKADLAVATISWIRNKEEGRVVFATIRNLSKLSVPLVIVDGGSSEKDKSALSKFPNVCFFEAAHGLTKQLFLSHKYAASKADYLFYLHTDKLDFVRKDAERMINYYRNLKQKGMLIPARTAKSFKTYPAFQRTQEEFLNFFMSDYIGIKNDYYAGPAIYPSFLVKYLD